MEITEFLYEEAAAMASSRDIRYFPKYINDLFNKYLAKIDGLDNNTLNTRIKKKKHLIDGLCKAITNSIEKYYEGYPSEAYNQFYQGIQRVKSYLNYNNIGEGDLQSLYRMRTGNNFTYDKTQMFHIPFELRERVQTQRYSIPGLPCLYLGSSVYICWEELGKPDVNTVQVSRFEAVNQQDIKILDLGYSPNYLIPGITSHIKENGNSFSSALENKIIKFVVIWPLIRACSVKVDDRQASFKPQYIIPQLTLQWITLNKDFDGIRYLSVNSDSYRASYGLFYNYVLPVKTNLQEGLCQVLKAKFKVTHTVSWQVAKLLSIRPLQGNTGVKKIQLIPGIIKHYEDTDFGYIEKVLQKMPADYIDLP